MRLDRRGDEPAHRLLDRLRRNFRQRAAHDLHDLLIMAIDDGGNERLLAGEILIERADAYARLFGDPVGAGLSKPSLTRMRAVASTSASTVARDRS